MLLPRDDASLPRALALALEPDEQVRWSSRPAVWASALRLLPIVLVCVAFGAAVLWAASTSPGISDPFFDYLARLVFRPLGALIIVLAIAASVQEYRRIQRTVYAITDRRVLSMDVASSGEVIELRAPQIDAVQRTERLGGTGDLAFLATGQLARAGDPLDRGRSGARLSFIGVARVREVERLAMGLRPSAPRAGTPFSELSPAAAARFELVAGETLLWLGRPRADYVPRRLRRQIWGAVASVIVGGSLYFLAPNLGEPDPWWRLLFLSGIGFLAAVLWRWVRREPPAESYAVTDRRLIIASDEAQREVASFEHIDPRELVADVRANGVGALYFARVRPPDTDRPQPIGFIGIPGVRAVERLVRETFLRRR